MIEQDTVKLLRECDAGVKMGVESIDDVLSYVSSPELASMLNTCKDEHHVLGREIESALCRFHDEGKNPNMMIKTMATAKTNMEMMVKPSDSTIASLMTDGCNMGVKSLSKYLNEYKAADENAKALCKRLISIEEQLARDLRGYL